MKVYISNRQKSLDFKPERQKIKKIVQFVLDQEKRCCDEVAIFFITDHSMKRMHNQFFNDPSSTDCMSFPIDESYLGDIFVCPETAVSYAKVHNKDPYKETTLYIVHGILHLLGYDDIDMHDRKKMRMAERRHMSGLEKQGLILQGLILHG